MHVPYELWKVAGDFDMGTQQVSGILCTRTKTKGKGGGCTYSAHQKSLVQGQGLIMLERSRLVFSLMVPGRV